MLLLSRRHLVAPVPDAPSADKRKATLLLWRTGVPTVGVRRVHVIVAAFVLMPMLAVSLAAPAQAAGASRVFRIAASGDAYVVAISSSCTDGPDPPLHSGCFLARNELGYDGLTGASVDTRDHINHRFRCEVVSSLTGFAGNAPPYPADMALGDSVTVGLYLDHDGPNPWVYYGDRFRAPGPVALLDRVGQAAHAGDVARLASTPGWFAERVDAAGPQRIVEGNVDGPLMVLWYEGGLDATVNCEF